MSQNLHQGRWYIRKNGRIQGPFPNQLISSYLILGRIDLESEISQDQVNWAPVKNFRALVPEVVLHADTPEGARALMLARVREDERSARSEEDASVERRAEEDQAIKLHRQLRDDIRSGYHNRFQSNWRYWVPIVTVAVVIIGGFLFYRPAPRVVSADCSAPARPGVDWSGCSKQGLILSVRDLSGSRWTAARLNGSNLMGSKLDNSDLSYANFTQVNFQQASLQRVYLKGAVLDQADLQGADLRGADLSYAEMSGALLNDARLDGARFDHAIWINGKACLPGSIGGCLQAK